MKEPDSSKAQWAAAKYGDRRDRDLGDGAVAGLLGAGSIIILFSAFDALFFGPLATPGQLSETLIDLGAIATDFGVRMSYGVRMAVFTVLHLATFVVLGTVLASLFSMSGVRNKVLLGGLYGITACSGTFFTALHLSGTQLAATSEWPAVLLGNFVAGVVMGGYLEVRASSERKAV